MSKEALNIEVLEKIVENFWNLKFIKLPQDIFQLDYNKIENLDGWGRQSVANLKYSIDLRKNITLEKIYICSRYTSYWIGKRKINFKKFEIYR